MKKALIFFAVILALGALLYILSTKTSPLEPRGEDQSSLPEAEGLPSAVEAKRQAIYRAALARDYEKLSQEAELIFNYSFGGSEPGGFVEHLKAGRGNQNNEIFDLIISLLELPYGRQLDIYAWPQVFVKSAEEWTEDDVAEMSTLLSDEEIESYRQFGGYAYYRLGITEAGKWVYFISGD